MKVRTLERQPKEKDIDCRHSNRPRGKTEKCSNISIIRRRHGGQRPALSGPRKLWDIMDLGADTGMKGRKRGGEEEEEDVKD